VQAYYAHALERKLEPVTIHLHSAVLSAAMKSTSATLLLQAGEIVKVVSERLGHSKTSVTTDIDAHVLPTMGRAAAEKMGAVLYGRQIRRHNSAIPTTLGVSGARWRSWGWPPISLGKPGDRPSPAYDHLPRLTASLDAHRTEGPNFVGPFSFSMRVSLAFS
jgi:hypothetical protein